MTLWCRVSPDKSILRQVLFEILHELRKPGVRYCLQFTASSLSQWSVSNEPLNTPRLYLLNTLFSTLHTSNSVFPFLVSLSFCFSVKAEHPYVSPCTVTLCPPPFAIHVPEFCVIVTKLVSADTNFLCPMFLC
jgi:hypothetical protein